MSPTIQNLVSLAGRHRTFALITRVGVVMESGEGHFSLSAAEMDSLAAAWLELRQAEKEVEMQQTQALRRYTHREIYDEITIPNLQVVLPEPRAYSAYDASHKEYPTGAGREEEERPMGLIERFSTLRTMPRTRSTSGTGEVR